MWIRAKLTLTVVGFELSEDPGVTQAKWFGGTLFSSSGASVFRKICLWDTLNSSEFFILSCPFKAFITSPSSIDHW